MCIGVLLVEDKSATTTIAGDTFKLHSEQSSSVMLLRNAAAAGTAMLLR